MKIVSPYFGQLAKRTSRPSLLINTLSNWVALVTTVVAGLFLTPYIITQLGKTGYGIWTLIYSIIGYYGILDLGVTSAITRYVARYAGRKDHKALNETISSAIALFIFVGLVTVSLSFLIAGPLSSFFNIQPEFIDEFQHATWILGSSAGLGFLGYLFGAVIKAHERFVIANSITIAITVMRTGLMVLLLSSGFGLIGIAWSHLISVVVMAILNYTLCKFLFPHVHGHRKEATWSMVRILLGFGAATTIMQVADIMRFNLDSFVIGKWISIEAVAVYGVAALLVRFYLQFISKGIQSVFTPRFSALDGEGKQIELQQLFLKSLSVAAFLSFGIGCLILVLGKRFILLWVGIDFVDAVPVLYILAISYSLALSQTTGIAVLYALRKHYILAYVSIIEGFVNVALSIYLAPRYGIVGVAIGTAAPMLVIKLFVQPIYISRIMEIPVYRYWSQILPALICAIGVIVMGRWVPEINFFGSSYSSLCISAILYIGMLACANGLVYILTQKNNIARRTLEDTPS